MFSRAVSTSRTTVNIPSRKTAGSTAATNGMNASGDCDMNPIATSALDSANTYNELRAAASEMVELAAVCSTKCSVVNADRSAASVSVSDDEPDVIAGRRTRPLHHDAGAKPQR